jgi:hypothetical protein
MNNLSQNAPAENAGRSKLAALNEWVAQVAALTKPMQSTGAMEAMARTPR